jgi:hypothetical protein
LDPGCGASPFCIFITQWQDNEIRVLYADDFDKADYAQMLTKVYSLMSKYDVDSVYVDGSAVSFIRSLKIQIGEEADYEQAIARYKSEGYQGDSWHQNMKVIPVNFGSEHRSMLDHCRMVLSDNYIAIHPRFEKLIIALRTATDQDGSLQKDLTSHNDIFDSFRLALKFYRFEETDR